MKIHQLPMGARFEFEGDEYVKTGAMSGTGNNGPRLIPRYALLKPLDNVAPSPTHTTDDALRRSDVLEAFRAFYNECRCLVSADNQEALNAARDHFLKRLGHPQPAVDEIQA